MSWPVAFASALAVLGVVATGGWLVSLLLNAGIVWPFLTLL